MQSNYFILFYFFFALNPFAWHIRYLALVAALACEADFVFIPEWPPEIGWAEVLCKKLKQARRFNKHHKYDLCTLHLST